MDIIDYVDKINLSFGATEVITNPETDKVREIERRAMSVGLKLLHSNENKLYTKQNFKMCIGLIFSASFIIIIY